MYLWRFASDPLNLFVVNLKKLGDFNIFFFFLRFVLFYKYIYLFKVKKIKGI